MLEQKQVIVIGGGAAGFFAALSLKKHHPNCNVIILEKSAKVLAKVKISGGGRCNVTHACFENNELSKFYPRGEKFLKKAFTQFNTESTIEWFKERNVPLEALHDQCIFPKSNSSQTIIDCFEKEAKELGVIVKIQANVKQISKLDSGKFEINTLEETYFADKVIVTIGGQPKRNGLEFLEKMGHKIIEPLPSLFTFNMPQNPICELMGNVVEKTSVKIEATKLVANGPLLVTHWGMSGPVILKLSAWGARILAEKNYHFHILVNWLNESKEEELRGQIQSLIYNQGEKKIVNLNPFPMTNRLWCFLLDKIEINKDIRWKELGKKNLNRLVNLLINDRYEISGKTTFKEEFVTAGGVSLEDIDFTTMQSKKVSGLFFAGEVLDIDGITGGFNFQAAWTTGWIAGKHCML
ncbi:MAG: NAD(P)/FAD-dependent oxidoreductase [Flavobacteriia bacterium]|nr:NAD(P)/FAD-dependent oxidoreductase [Flavobacteriia bacterium]